MRADDNFRRQYRRQVAVMATVTVGVLALVFGVFGVLLAQLYH
jgi:small neutral amino acid transporter SnatA (MarC family)